jgi:hypothetical protein
MVKHRCDGIAEIAGFAAEEFLCREQEPSAGGRIGGGLPQWPEEPVAARTTAPLPDDLTRAFDVLVHLDAKGPGDKALAHDRPRHHDQDDQGDEIAGQVTRGGLGYLTIGVKRVEQSPLLTEDPSQQIRTDLLVPHAGCFEFGATGRRLPYPAARRADCAAALGWVQTKVAHAWYQHSGGAEMDRSLTSGAKVEKDPLVDGTCDDDREPPWLLPSAAVSLIGGSAISR